MLINFGDRWKTEQAYWAQAQGTRQSGASGPEPVVWKSHSSVKRHKTSTKQMKNVQKETCFDQNWHITENDQNKMKWPPWLAVSQGFLSFMLSYAN